MFKLYSGTIFCTILILITSIEINAQNNNNLVGKWNGKLTDSIGEFEYQLNLIEEKDGKYIGTSVSKSAGFYCETNIVGIRNRNKILIIESGIRKTNYDKKDLICLLKFDLIINNNKLLGNYTPINNKSNCLSGSVGLIKEQINALPTFKINKPFEPVKEEKPSFNIYAKQDKFDTIKEQVYDQILVTPPPKIPIEIDKALEKRDSKLIKIVELFDDEAELFIYDNGVIDGDIITLIDNDRVLLKNVLLSKNPIKLKINNLNERVHNIIFFAENLGEIPPNTGLLVIKTKSTKFELFFSSDFAQSSFARILFK
jgi:hypothetical protein